jgi:RNA polymerase sigma factor (sigma-70 family)
MSESHDPEFLKRLEAALSNMPRLQREIFLAVRLDDLSYEEIARRTGLTVRRVERQFARSLYKLSKQIAGRRLSWWERWF